MASPSEVMDITAVIEEESGYERSINWPTQHGAGNNHSWSTEGEGLVSSLIYGEM